jgi:hypothetical protein
MFSSSVVPPSTDISNNAETSSQTFTKYKNYIQTTDSVESAQDLNYNAIDKLLENEKNQNKTESWNKLDKTVKIQKLHAFAEKYGKDHAIPIKDIKTLKAFFVDCLEKGKLQKTKDVIYDRDSREITSIPALYFNVTNRAFTLKIMDAKRVSTLKSLTPKRNTTVDAKTTTEQTDN